MGTTAFVIIILLVFAALLYGFYWLQKKHYKFSTRVFSALAVGIMFGGVLQLIFSADSDVLAEATSWMGIVGNGYVSLLQMLVMPLVFISIVGAFTRLKISEKLGKIAFNVLATLLGTTAIAAAIGIGSVLLFGLAGTTFTEGAAETARIAELANRQEAIADLTIPEQIVSFIPNNIFSDLAGNRATSTIAVVIFAAFVGVAYLGVRRKKEEDGDFFAKIINSLQSIILRIVTLVLRLTPYGILALMTATVATSDFNAILDLGTFVLASYAALITVFLIHMIILMLFQVSPIRYLKKTFTVLSFAFTSRSSAGALPLNIETQTKALGVDDATANFAASFGLSIGQNGCAGVYPAMLAIMVAPTTGQTIDLAYILLVIAVVVISSFGVAGVGGGATFASLIVLSALNLPVAIVGLVISVEPLIDMARTALNVNDSMLAGVITSKQIGDFNDQLFNDENAVVSSD